MSRTFKLIKERRNVIDMLNVLYFSRLGECVSVVYDVK
jgi:hypothetical protein